MLPSFPRGANQRFQCGMNDKTSDETSREGLRASLVVYSLGSFVARVEVMFNFFHLNDHVGHA